MGVNGCNRGYWKSLLCAQSSPILQAPKSNKRDAKLFIAFRPVEKIINEVSVTAGYEFNKNNSVTATIWKK